MADQRVTPEAKMAVSSCSRWSLVRAMGPDEHPDRHDDCQQLWHGKQRQPDHDPDALAAFDDDLELIQTLAQNADSGQGRASADDGAGDLPEKIALNKGHVREKSPVAGGGEGEHLIHTRMRR